MKVIVLGAGIIGVTSAYQLAKAGHEVIVIDRQAGPALETSFANAGEVSFGYCSPWASPGLPAKALRWMLMRHAPLILRPRPDWAMLSWMLKMLSNCTTSNYAINKSRMLRLSDYSRVSLAALRAETNISYDQQMKGTLQLFRTQHQLEASARDVQVLAADGIPYELLDRKGCIQMEPALDHVSEKFVGGLLTPKDETGDCFKFTNELSAVSQALGVRFLYNVTATSLNVEAGAATGVTCGSSQMRADAVVVALGSYSSQMVKPHGINLPLYPVKGYSLTIPIRNADRAPQSTVMDETFKIAITRLGDRIRVGGMAEISGFRTDLVEARRRTLEHSVSDLFPGGDIERATFWTGLRPMTPDGTPIVGKTRIKGLYINTGHGTLGWTMSTGSARVISDLVSGTLPEIDASDLSVLRYQRTDSTVRT